MTMFDWFHVGKLDVQCFNCGIITLLPKFTDAILIQRFRPICLLRCIYKIITRLMTLRLDFSVGSSLVYTKLLLLKGGISWMSS